ncbi:MAG TPA: hypothetical protein VF135_12245, partial [Terriglobales bacterium]
MSIGKKKKDHLNLHSDVALATSTISTKSDDPLRFWTNHSTENKLIDLHLFANGEFENPHPNGPNTGNWGGPFTGRPQLIAELAPAIEARTAFLSALTARNFSSTLRAWWRLFDAVESISLLDGQKIARVESVMDLNELHEAAAHKRGMAPQHFRRFLSLANDTRRLMRLPRLHWVAPKEGEPHRTLLPDDQVRELKTALKQSWERVRHTWARNDAIRAEAERRFAGEIPSDLDDEQELLLKNWQHFRRVQQETGSILPTGEQLLGEWKSRESFRDHGLKCGVMRAILYPTVEEAQIAFLLALMNSGWNPSTLSGLDATSPFVLADHPKDDRQLVLSADEDEEVTLQSGKPRARGKRQFCTGLKKHSSSPPVIVAAYLKRVESLREILVGDYQAASKDLARMQAAGEEHEIIERQHTRVQKIRQGCRSVWLYVDRANEINWLDGMFPPRYVRKENSRAITYLTVLLDRVNAGRALAGKEPISPVSPSDFRDMYARHVYVQSRGNILAVMLALGHSSLRSTARYVENNIFAAETDEQIRRFVSHLFSELERGRIDLTILAQLVRDGPLTPEMEMRLTEYRKLMRSRVGAGCADPRHPPPDVAPGHVGGRLCGTHRCFKCPNSRFLPESLDGIAMRAEELIAMSDHLPRETWLRSDFQDELDEWEDHLGALYPAQAVAETRDKWRMRIAIGKHLVPGLGSIPRLERNE